MNKINGICKKCERINCECIKNCACNKQIVWFFEKPTIIACKNCEITFYHDIKVCPYCNEKVSYFVEEED